jgi:uncharacterized protein YkwD
MARIRILITLVVAICAIGVATAAVPAAAKRSPEALMMHKVNSYRARHGVRRVRLSHSLKRSARRYAHYMMRHQYFGHAKRIHASSKYHRLGEILEWQTGYKANVRRAFYCWVHSSEHRAIILDSSFTWAGAGRAHGRFHGRKSTIWVMHFGRK